MTLKIERYVHVPLYVQAVRVTAENMEEVVEWCEGAMCTVEEEGKEPVDYIKVATIRPIRARQTQAFEGDWVLKTDIGLKVFTEKAFRRAFVEAPEESDPQSLERLETVFKQPETV